MVCGSNRRLQICVDFPTEPPLERVRAWSRYLAEEGRRQNGRSTMRTTRFRKGAFGMAAHKTHFNPGDYEEEDLDLLIEEILLGAGDKEGGFRPRRSA